MRKWSLTQAASVLGEPQHRLIYLCEQGVVRPEHGEARGRGSSRLFSARNLLQFAVALHLRQLQMPVSVLAAVAYALTAFEEVVRTEEPGFRLPESLQERSAPDLRIVIGDGRILYLWFDGGRGTPRMFGGVDLQPLRTDRLALEALRQRWQFMKPLSPSDVFSHGADFGGPEGSRYWRLEVGVTRVARHLRLEL